ncbi:DUF6290 family protein [Fusobacterium necrophorum]|nr:DUF6290 family protein [Fusobacterium necrophorum]
MGISSYIKNIIYERLEDDDDIKCFDKEYQEYLESGKKSYSFDEVLNELGIEL